MSEDTILERHKKEKKELQAQIQQLKSSVPKGDKKKRKEVNAEIELLESNLTKKHTEELKDLENLKKIPDELEKVTLNEENLPNKPLAETQVKVSRAQKRKDKKAKKEAEKAMQNDDVQTVGAIEKMEEEKALSTKLQERGLKLFPIASDGNCMYAAFSHQLKQRGTQTSVQNLRRIVSTYMLQNAEQFMPYYTGDDDFGEYCKKVERTSEWGGEFELRALSELYKTPIEIMQASGSALVIGEHFDNKTPLILTYHLHAFRLGAHYNSVLPICTNGSQDENVYAFD